MLDSSDSDKDPSSSPSDGDFTPSDATTPDLPEWPKTDTDSNLRRALRKEGPIVAPPFPNMTNLSAFKQAICEAVINASARTDHFRLELDPDPSRGTSDADDANGTEEGGGGGGDSGARQTLKMHSTRTDLQRPLLGV